MKHVPEQPRSARSAGALGEERRLPQSAVPLPKGLILGNWSVTGVIYGLGG